MFRHLIGRQQTTAHGQNGLATISRGQTRRPRGRGQMRRKPGVPTREYMCQDYAHTVRHMQTENPGGDTFVQTAARASGTR